ncbi:CPBP family intramembrane glutamic endopeptidase [Vitiosangium sp. GDMCC 1.1324]|uniref:CPBP family intramembrane glutamic endopeptidase n=1 Tax=Vitiosangium sp. (strain GDMCC 1.1324) TaxID=2138576 RepID=UPI000D37F0CE|nr:CPBP family intramembrane glutamic endopeptidase [Vitiosangium sp. GDMCC 1.1324]PTL84006.1 CPBP family intramembrane metalloprotease [Vitiosangium sp. GDMCC 1.1324]
MTTPGRHQAWLMASTVAVLPWTALVHVHPPRFFLWATLYCAVWNALSWNALGEEGRSRLAPRRVDLLWGVALAGVLYVGSRAVLWALCGGFSEVLCKPLMDIYATFGTGSLGAALALALVIAPAEELFWRGVVQQALRPRLGRGGGALVAAVLSSLVLLIFREPLLALAAFPTSLAWGLLAEWRRSLAASWVSHSLWDVLIVILLPAV